MASLLAVQPAMMQDRNCFELYGYDILLSDDLRPWLLEVNASPALTGTDNEDHRLKFDLIDDVLNVLDFEVDQAQSQSYSSEERSLWSCSFYDAFTRHLENRMCAINEITQKKKKSPARDGYFA